MAAITYGITELAVKRAVAELQRQVDELQKKVRELQKRLAKVE